MGKNGRRKPQEPVRVARSSLMQRATIGLAGAAVVGLTYAMFSVAKRPADPVVENKQPVQVMPPQVDATAAAYESEKEKLRSLVEQFSALPEARQTEVFERVVRACDERTGLGAYYDSIINQVSPQIVSPAGLEERACTDPRARFVRDRLGGMAGAHAAYVAYADLIIVPARENAALLSTILQGRTTPKGILAHEVLHKVQNDESKVMLFYNFLQDKGYLNQGATELNLSKVHTDELTRLLGFRDLDSATPLLSRCANSVQTIPELQALFEMQARCLAPKAVSTSYGSLKFKISASTQGHAYGYTNEMFNSCFPLIVAAYGKAVVEKAPNVDIAAAHFVGRNGSSFGSLAEALENGGMQERYFNEGLEFFRARSVKLDAVPVIAKEVLAEYGMR